MSKRFASSCERNQQPILEQLLRLLKDSQHVLEIGSGTGQHASYFARHLPFVTWHTSDHIDNHESILAWIKDSPSHNIIPPIAFLIGQQPWPDLMHDAIFTANTTHIMQRDSAKLMMQTISQYLPQEGIFCQYGPFNVDGKYTSEGNRAFDEHLLQNGYGGLCDITELQQWGTGLVLSEQIAMPANNFLLVWRNRNSHNNHTN